MKSKKSISIPEEMVSKIKDFSEQKGVGFSNAICSMVDDFFLMQSSINKINKENLRDLKEIVKDTVHRDDNLKKEILQELRSLSESFIELRRMVLIIGSADTETGLELKSRFPKYFE